MSRLAVEFHPEAAEEASQARQWYAERSQAAAEAFARELDAAVNRICRHPDLYPDYRHGTKFAVLRRFPYVLVFRRSQDAVQVVAVAHGRRRPGYWEERTDPL